MGKENICIEERSTNSNLERFMSLNLASKFVNQLASVNRKKS